MKHNFLSNWASKSSGEMRTGPRAVWLSGLTLVAVMATEATAQDAPKQTGWARNAALGFTLTRGNSKNLLFTGDLLASRKWAREEVNLGASATYGEADSVKNAESLRGFGQWNHLFNDRTYGFIRLEGLHDAVADIEYRFVLSPGLGHYFIKNERTTLSGEVGPGFVYEKQGDNETGYITLRLAERFEHQLNEKTKIWQSLEILPQVDDFENYIVNAEAGIDTKLTESLNLRVFVQDTYDNEPAPGRLKNDIKLVTALAYKF